MALALSLSLDLFLMKGNLFIAVRAQPETDRRTDRQGRETTEQARGRWRKENKRKKRRAEQRDVVNVFTKRERCREH